jgi:5S rRNA maturation endonuclease (ribonuclease M5)
MPISNTLSKFKLKNPNSKNNRYQAYCPAHEDKNASLSILVDNERILLHCHAGCTIEEIMKSVGITYDDLFAGNPPTKIYQYRNEDGSLNHEKLRYQTDKGKTFRQRRIDNGHIVDNLEGVNKVPYNLPEINKAIKSGNPVLLVEGEKDADTASNLGFTSTTLGGASDWKEEYKFYFKNASVINIPDKDDAGMKFSNNIKKSLETVCKSLKVLILPEGKDLTEWVERGNTSEQLKKLVNESPELIKSNGIPLPIMGKRLNGYQFDWNGLNLKINIERLRDEEGEIVVSQDDTPFYISGIKLLSVSHRTSIARSLNTQRKLDWDRVLNQITTMCLDDMRKGEDVLFLDEEYGSKPPEYLLKPLFVKNSANIIYADKSSAKSLLMIMFDVALSLPWWDNEIGLDVKNEKHNVLFLDWENDAYVTGWQKECFLRGINIGYCAIPYLRCNRPLVDCLDHVKAKIDEVKADVVIIDSLGVAVGDDLNLTKPAFAFFNALRQLPVTPLIIAHTAKDFNNKRKTVYGNAFYENESRSIWEAKKTQEAGSNKLIASLFQRKAPPFSGYSEPLAWQFTFDGGNTYVEKTEPITDDRVIKESSESELSVPQIVLSIMEECGKPVSPKEIQEITDPPITGNNIRQALYQLKNTNKVKVVANSKYIKI